MHRPHFVIMGWCLQIFLLNVPPSFCNNAKPNLRVVWNINSDIVSFAKLWGGERWCSCRWCSCRRSWWCSGWMTCPSSWKHFNILVLGPFRRGWCDTGWGIIQASKASLNQIIWVKYCVNQIVPTHALEVHCLIWKPWQSWRGGEAQPHWWWTRRRSWSSGWAGW